MKETTDMMEDAMSEDTMMDCGGDSNGLDDLVDQETDFSNAAPTIRGVAERILNLLSGENSDNDDEDDDLLNYSEDEGVDLDEEESEDDSEDPINTKLLHQLAVSLTQELKFSKRKNLTSCKNQESSRDYQDDQSQNMELGQDINNQNKNINFNNNYYCNELYNSKIIEDSQISGHDGFVSNKRCRLDQNYRVDEEPEENNINKNSSSIPSSWDVGWDECTAEAVKYLTEVEGLSPQNPIVLALKSHLQLQRDMTCPQFSL